MSLDSDEKRGPQGRAQSYQGQELRHRGRIIQDYTHGDPIVIPTSQFPSLVRLSKLASIKYRVSASPVKKPTQETWIISPRCHLPNTEPVDRSPFFCSVEISHGPTNGQDPTDSKTSHVGRRVEDHGGALEASDDQCNTTL